MVSFVERGDTIRIISARKADRGEYEDYARPNRFAERLNKETTLVVLDPDVATVFQTSEAVNEALRVIIAAAGNLTAAQRIPDIHRNAAPTVARVPS